MRETLAPVRFHVGRVFANGWSSRPSEIAFDPSGGALHAKLEVGRDADLRKPFAQGIVGA